MCVGFTGSVARTGPLAQIYAGDPLPRPVWARVPLPPTNKLTTSALPRHCSGRDGPVRGGSVSPSAVVGASTQASGARPSAGPGAGRQAGREPRRGPWPGRGARSGSPLLLPSDGRLRLEALRSPALLPAARWTEPERRGGREGGAQGKGHGEPAAGLGFPRRTRKRMRTRGKGVKE